jgi:segregation and condensation protein B
MEATEIKPIIEAALLASGQPMSIPQLETLLAADPGDSVTGAQVATALHALGEDCSGRGIELVEVASGFRYQVRQDIHPWVARMWTERPSRYSRALLETLALIAYRQPITRGEIEQVRGVTVSSHIIKTLEEREWIRVVGHRDTPGRPALFGTTRTFLDYFNLKSLDELPPLADILNLDSMDPQLALGQQTPDAGPPADTDTAARAAVNTDVPYDANDPSDSGHGADTETADQALADTDPADAGQPDPEEDRA